MLTLVCYVRGDHHTRVFDVKINKTESVADLKKAIKKGMRPKFNDIPVDSLRLWKASVQCSKNLEIEVEALNLLDDDLLSPYMILSDIFLSDLEKKSVHIIIKLSQLGKLQSPILYSPKSSSTSCHIRFPFAVTLRLCQSVCTVFKLKALSGKFHHYKRKQIVPNLIASYFLTSTPSRIDQKCKRNGNIYWDKFTTTSRTIL